MTEIIPFPVQDHSVLRHRRAMARLSRAVEDLQAVQTEQLESVREFQAVNEQLEARMGVLEQSWRRYQSSLEAMDISPATESARAVEKRMEGFLASGTDKYSCRTARL